MKKEMQELVKRLNRTQSIAMENYKDKRVNYPFETPILFDCRFFGAGERLVQSRYEQMLNQFSLLSRHLSENGGKVDLKFVYKIPGPVLKIMQEITAKNFNPTQVNCRLKMERVRIAARVSKELGRQVSADEYRRMGIGDQIVLIAAIQAVCRKLDPAGIVIVYDELYPSSKSLFEMAKFPDKMKLIGEKKMDKVLNYFDDYCVIPLRRHFLEHPLTDGVPCYYGEQKQSPLAQFLWNVGWENEIALDAISKIDFKDDSNFKPDVKKAKYITCQPLELTRMNVRNSPAVYSTALQLQNKADHIIFGCMPTEIEKMAAFVNDINLPKSRFTWEICCTDLKHWYALIKRGVGHYCGNNGGMWLGIAAGAPLVIFSQTNGIHGRMWQPGSHWFERDRFGADIVVID